MKSAIKYLFSAAALLTAVCAAAQRPTGFAYYDTDRLYDTVPALFYDDSDFTPEGRLHWNSVRYERKIARTAAVLDSMHMDIVALAGVENESVVRDVVTACGEAYCYLHRTLNSFDGLDIALLFHADRFYPAYAEEGRGWIYVEGTLDGEKIGLLLCCNGRYADEALTDCLAEHTDVKLIAAGRFPADAAGRYSMDDALARAENAGRGNTRSRNGWRMAERILADTSLHVQSGDVYARRWLMDKRGAAPRPTYERNLYRNGYGRTLPVFTYLCASSEPEP